MEVVARLLTDEGDELVRVAEFSRLARTGREIAAQRHDMANSVLDVLRENVAERFARAADARHVRHGFHAVGTKLERGGERAFAVRASRTERNRAERRFELKQLPPRRAQLLDRLGSSRRKEFEAEQAVGAHEFG